MYHTTSCELENELQDGHDLGLSEFEVLKILSSKCCDSTGKAKMKDLEAEMYLSQSALSRTVTRLEKAGLVTRATCDFDRRAMFLMLTPAGQERYEAAQPTYRGVLLRHFA
ncbi:MarR family transcriptional regulator [Glycomyces sp. NPDC047010]|uniref:MarR family winged helix-turn-helix transcriptional regulator n=1 Tax=Glycomyces sp. NPDC047010 TaxID=3155023 RepID=UPI0033FBADE8